MRAYAIVTVLRLVGAGNHATLRWHVRPLLQIFCGAQNAAGAGCAGRLYFLLVRAEVGSHAYLYRRAPAPPHTVELLCL